MLSQELGSTATSVRILSLRNMEYCPMREYKKIWNRYQQKSEF